MTYCANKTEEELRAVIDANAYGTLQDAHAPLWQAEQDAIDFVAATHDKMLTAPLADVVAARIARLVARAHLAIDMYEAKSRLDYSKGKKKTDATKADIRHGWMSVDETRIRLLELKVEQQKVDNRLHDYRAHADEARNRLADVEQMAERYVRANTKLSIGAVLLLAPVDVLPPFKDPKPYNRSTQFVTHCLKSFALSAADTRLLNATDLLCYPAPATFLAKWRSYLTNDAKMRALEPLPEEENSGPEAVAALAKYAKLKEAQDKLVVAFSTSILHAVPNCYNKAGPTDCCEAYGGSSEQSCVRRRARRFNPYGLSPF